MKTLIRSYKDLEVYKISFTLGMKIFTISKKFPKEEKYSLTDQILRSSRSISANICEAYAKRNYSGHFVFSLIVSEAELLETQNWLDYSFHCHYINKTLHFEMTEEYDQLLKMISKMRNQPEKWKYL